MSINERLTLRFLSNLLGTPAGRAHMLNQCADAEATDEGEMFDRILAQVDDPELARLVRRHQADELMHAEMFRACVARTGITPPPVPQNLKLLARIDKAIGGPKPVESRDDVMHAYLLLQVIEERATTQFAIFERAFRSVDPETADTFASIAKDEARHLKYCQAISKRYAPSEAVREKTLRELRVVESLAFAENSRANMEFTFARGYVTMSPIEKTFWRGLTAVRGALGTGQPTPFAQAA
ncbi:MAG: ferritin-like domain-containing protein [Polyangiaceae bacterium]